MVYDSSPRNLLNKFFAIQLLITIEIFVSEILQHCRLEREKLFDYYIKKIHSSTNNIFTMYYVF